MQCYLFNEPTYLFFTTGLPHLLYYSHIPSAIIALLIGFFVFFNDRNALLNKLLLLIAICFSSWTLISLISWTNIHGDIILFIWPLFGVLQAFIAILSVYFIYVFLEKKDIPFKLKLIFFTLLAPVLLFAHTDVSVSGINLTACDSFGYEGLGYKIYYTGLGFLAMFWILFLLTKKYLHSEQDFRKQILLIGIGIESFLFSFTFFTFIATYLTGLGILPDSSLEHFGLFGMTVFMIFIGIMIVRYRTFNVGLIASQALIIALVLLIGSQFTFSVNTTTAVLTSITLILTGVIGVILIRSVKKEVKLREDVENLVHSLALANEKLTELDKLKSEFVSIASHQLRAPLTAVRGYASMLLDGSFGKIPTEATQALERISESAKNMAYSVEDYLNVSRIESGNMKYNCTDFNLRDEAEHVCDDLRPQALRKGLVLIFRTDLKSQGVINADVGKVIQVIQNLINNAIKYTKKGSIKVLVRDDIVRKKIYIDVEDTGIGMNKETMDRLFGKFERAKNANQVNNGGTGLGLYVAYAMTIGMKGNITAHSEGDEKGSRFTIEFPLAL